MKTRIISALIGIPILIAVLYFHQTVIFNAALAGVCVLGVYEFLHATKYVTNPYVLIVSMVFAGVIPFLNYPVFQDRLYLIVFVYIILLSMAFFNRHSTLLFKQLGIAVAVSVMLPFAISAFVFVRDLNKTAGLYYILLIFFCAWISDAGAYFTGMLFGRHKLAPNISPKKTVEGAVGGVIFCILVNIAFTYIYIEILGRMGTVINSNLFALLAVSLVGSLIGIFGDLFASIVKRQTGIKDFGNLIPGHGGVIDRFDSVLFIAPFIYLFMQYFPIVTLGV